jgi:hypothetical protein
LLVSPLHSVYLSFAWFLLLKKVESYGKKERERQRIQRR